MNNASLNTSEILADYVFRIRSIVGFQAERIYPVFGGTA